MTTYVRVQADELAEYPIVFKNSTTGIKRICRLCGNHAWYGGSRPLSGGEPYTPEDLDNARNGHIQHLNDAHNASIEVLQGTIQT